MGEPREPAPALGVIGVLVREPEVLDEAIQRLSRGLGGVHLTGASWEFTWSDYYQDELGHDLKRCFLRLDSLVPRGLLADFKRACVRLEQDLAASDGRRRINLDPGLLCTAQWVLASTKARPHRMYLGLGIWAEVTLTFERGAFQPLPWTYPDYRSAPIRALLAALRLEYKEALRVGGTCLRADALQTGDWV